MKKSKKLTTTQLLAKFPSLLELGPVQKNCLTDIACPACGWRSEFNIEVTTIMSHTDDGTDNHFDTDPTGDYIKCGRCGHEGKYAEFEFKDLDAQLQDHFDAIREAKIKQRSALAAAEVKCDNCYWFGKRADLHTTFPDIPNLLVRLGPGSTCPEGECPKCQAFCYAITKTLTPV